jgi:hypothetical protein
MTWLTGAMLAFGAACLVLGFRVRVGSSRTFYAVYRTNALQRNAAFALIPAGIWLIAAAGAIVRRGRTSESRSACSPRSHSWA